MWRIMTYSPQLDKYPRTSSYHPKGKTFDDIGDPFAHPMTYKEQNETVPDRQFWTSHPAIPGLTVSAS